MIMTSPPVPAPATAKTLPKNSGSSEPPTPSRNNSTPKNTRPRPSRAGSIWASPIASTGRIATALRATPTAATSAANTVARTATSIGTGPTENAKSSGTMPITLSAPISTLATRTPGRHPITEATRETIRTSAAIIL